MKRFLVLILCFLLIPSTANAGQADFGRPVGIIFTQWNVVLFTTNGVRYNPPTSCANFQVNRFAIPTNTDWGKAMVSMLLTAQARGKRVWINGSGNCNLWGDSEGVDYLVIED